MAAHSSSTYSRPVVMVGLLTVLGCLVAVADANVFLGRLPPQHATAALSAESERTLLAELEVALGHGHRHATEKRLKRLEQMISPMFAAMTKTEHGKVGSAAAGYVLHRVFVQRHGWFIRALEPEGNALASWNSSKPISILEERVPQHVQELFAKRLGEQGLGLHELAILASSLEHLVHVEALDRLSISYQAKNFSKEDVLSKEEVDGVLDMYMSIYILGFLHSDLATMTPSTAQELHANVLELYPTWHGTQNFLREVFKSVAPTRDYVYFNEVENAISEIGERYGRFQDQECREFKDWLVAAEDQSVGGEGRVRISDFYAMALNEGRWQFSEGVNYLRELGALDESDPSNLRVIIPNYVSSPSNCVASSAYYSVCCVNECEGILGRIEQFISAPEALPSTILNLVGTVASATVPSNRTLSTWLQQRLNEVAEHHDGLVPLHGRLFAQWLHYAYPRECAFPHAAGTINPQRPEDILASSDEAEESISVNGTVMRLVVDTATAPTKLRIPGSEADAGEESGMWSMDEELVVWRAPHQPSSPWSSWVRTAALLGAALSFSIALVRSLEPMLKGSQKAQSDKYYV